VTKNDTSNRAVTIDQFDRYLAIGKRPARGVRGICPECRKPAAISAAGYLEWHRCPGHLRWEQRVDSRRRAGLDRTLDRYTVIDHRDGSIAAGPWWGYSWANGTAQGLNDREGWDRFRARRISEALSDNPRQDV
jgi:hypothetical protein